MSRSRIPSSEILPSQVQALTRFLCPIGGGISEQGLIKSNNRPEQQEGVRLLSEIFRGAPERRRECLYYLALGNFKLGNYGEARRYNDLLLEKEPANLQATSLGSLIEDKVAKEGLVGIAILGGLAVAAGVVGSLILKGTRRR